MFPNAMAGNSAMAVNKETNSGESPSRYSVPPMNEQLQNQFPLVVAVFAFLIISEVNVQYPNHIQK